MSTLQKIAPFLWFDSQAEEAAKFYCGIFKNSKIVKIARYGKAGFEHHHRPAGSVMTVAFELDGQSFVALNGGPVFKFSEAISFAGIARARRKSTISGRSSPPTARASAAGSRTSTGSRGRSCRPGWATWRATPIQAKAIA